MNFKDSILSQSSIDSEKFGEIKRLNKKLNDIESHMDIHLSKINETSLDINNYMEESTKDTIKDSNRN